MTHKMQHHNCKTNQAVRHKVTLFAQFVCLLAMSEGIDKLWLSYENAQHAVMRPMKGIQRCLLRGVLYNIGQTG